MTNKTRIKLIKIIIILIFVISGILYYSSCHINFYFNYKLYTNEVQIVPYGEKFNPGYMEVYFEDNNTKHKIDYTVYGIDNVNTNTLGQYEIKYSAKYLIWSKEITQIIEVKDLEKPIIAVNCENPYYLNGNTFVPDFDFVATDNVDGNITDKVDINKENNYVLYSVTDSSGNKTEEKVEIIDGDNKPPTIKLVDGDINLNVYDCYTEPGYGVVDNVDDKVDNIEVNSNLDTKNPGTYFISYTATDSSGNTSEVKRNIIVSSSELPEKQIPEEKTIYLTFDDGPSEYTNELLDILKKYNVKATFFVTNFKPEYNSVIKRESEEGHAIGIHTATHEYSNIYQSKEAYIDDFIQMHDIVYKETGINTRMFRFPGGSSNNISTNYCPGIMTDLTTYFPSIGYQYYDWNVSSGDANSKATTQSVYENVIKGIDENEIAIVLQHDTKKFSIDAVEDIINYGLENGYKFDTLSLSSPTAHHNVVN